MLVGSAERRRSVSKWGYWFLMFQIMWCELLYMFAYYDSLLYIIVFTHENKKLKLTYPRALSSFHKGLKWVTESFYKGFFN